MSKALLIQLALAVLLIGVLGAGYAFWYLSVERLSDSARGLGQDIQEKTEDASRIRAAQAELATLAASEAEVGQYFVSTGNIVGFLEELQKTGAGLGAKVEVVSVASDDSTSPGHLTLALKITGSFDAVLRTLGAMEYGPYDSALQSLTFDTPAGSATSDGWTAAAVFIVGTQKPADVAPQPSRT